MFIGKDDTPGIFQYKYFCLTIIFICANVQTKFTRNGFISSHTSIMLHTQDLLSHYRVQNAKVSVRYLHQRVSVFKWSMQSILFVISVG